MTPCAKFILDDYMQPRVRRLFKDDGGLLPSLRDAHFFDCTAILPIARQLAGQMAQHGSREVLGFLPAPLTWIEFQTWRYGWEGFLLSAEHGAATAREISAFWYAGSQPGGGSTVSYDLPLVMPPAASEQLARCRRMLAELNSGPLIHALLACINTPRVIGRKTHFPASKMQRAFARNRPMTGSFPRGAWTELVLSVTPPDQEAAAEQNAYLTGARALHFVRAHLRVRLGMLELIKAHHRGDPSLGIKRTRYRLVA